MIDCQDCPHDLRNQYGCYEPTQVVVWEAGDYEFYRCPIKFLNNQIIYWHREYSAVKSGIAAPDRYNERQDRWYEAARKYEYFLTMFNEKNKQRQKNRKNSHVKVHKKNG